MTALRVIEPVETATRQKKKHAAKIAIGEEIQRKGMSVRTDKGKKRGVRWYQTIVERL